jgi:hypothetical protein
MAQEEPEPAAFAGRQRQAAQHGEIERVFLARELADHGGEGATAQRLFHRPGAVALMGDAQADHARHGEAEQFEPRPVKGAAFELRRLRFDPQHRAARADVPSRK